MVADIPNQTINEGGSFTTINLDNYVNDIDNTDVPDNLDLQWQYQLDRIDCQPGGHELSTPNANWYGNETITFTATIRDF